MVREVGRHTDFLIRRLAEMGIEAVAAGEEDSAVGRIALDPVPFETLEDPFVAEEARFYTLGHNRLKFFEPAPFFQLPPLQIARCRNAADVEVALRRSWAAALRALRDGRSWLEQLGASVRAASGGTRLLLGVTGLDGPAAQVRGPGELLLPSAGALAGVSLPDPASRRYRPLSGLELGIDLELGLSQLVERLAAEAGERPAADGTPPLLDPQGAHPPRVLVLDDEAAALADTENLLRLQDFDVTAHQDPRRALEAFRGTSFDLVLVDRSMPRMDGLEFAMRVLALPGIDSLPIAILDDRRSAKRERDAEQVGVAAYLTKPLTWNDVGETVADLLNWAGRRRYRRYELRLTARALSAGGASELVEDIGRGGLRLRTKRELFPGAVELFEIALPEPHEPVRVDAEVAHIERLPGQASLLAGLRFRRFHDKGEERWIRLIDGLAQRPSADGADSGNGR